MENVGRFFYREFRPERFKDFFAGNQRSIHKEEKQVTWQRSVPVIYLLPINDCITRSQCINFELWLFDTTMTPNNDNAAFAPTEVEYQDAVAALYAELRATRGNLSPETIATVDANLRIIDEAIAESRAALRADPSNARIPLLLSGVYRKKVELLQHAVRLSART